MTEKRENSELRDENDKRFWWFQWTSTADCVWSCATNYRHSTRRNFAIDFNFKSTINERHFVTVSCSISCLAPERNCFIINLVMWVSVASSNRRLIRKWLTHTKVGRIFESLSLSKFSHNKFHRHKSFRTALHVRELASLISSTNYQMVEVGTHILTQFMSIR